MMSDEEKYMSVGWREWGSLPDLSIERIHMKIDTGAKTSAIHCVKHELFIKGDEKWVRFWTATDQETESLQVCEALLVDTRKVTSSGGHATHRTVVQCELKLGGKCWPIQLTLADRSAMKYRMLLGREAMKNLAVYPHKSHIQGN